ncbi:AAA family ATPase [Marinimicrobium locisalis]|uniref:AAA family ATPase n=1 Tax=Marinimicrobium locisalis TaxID=546022 RepID=UPI003221981A
MASSISKRAAKHFGTGLVVGKFSPLHHGHRYLLDRAHEECERLVVISYSRPEFPGCTKTLREHWLARWAPRAQRLVIDAADCARWQVSAEWALAMPDNGAADREQQAFCLALWRHLFPDVLLDAVFTSEAYGDSFASYLSEGLNRPVVHRCVDRKRLRWPVSGSGVRSTGMGGSSFCEGEILADMRCARIALVGAESTGKTTLCRELAESLGVPWVPEYGRELWVRRQGELTPEDLLEIARVQIEREDAAVRRARLEGASVVLCDTTPLTTLIYFRALFPGRPVPAELLALAERPYHQWWLCEPDFPLEQDGTRQDETFRQAQHHQYLAELEAREVSYLPLTGTLNEKKVRLSRYINNQVASA